MLRLNAGVAGITLAGVMALVSGSANAADMYRAQGGSLKDEPVYAFNWGGFYLGGHLGAGWGTADVSIPNYPSTFGMDGSGFTGGVHGGFNYQTGSLVLGVEADYSGSNVSGDHLSGGFGAERYSIEENWRSSVRGRLGVALNRTLVYGTVGVGWVDIDTQYVPLGGGGVRGATLTGLTAGGGVEYALSPNWLVRAEYLYGDYGSERFVHGGPSDVDYRTHELRAGVSYKFGSSYEPLK